MNCGIARILQFNEVFELGPVRMFDDSGMDITTACLYSWSSDMICWTDWVDYTTYERLIHNLDEDKYLRIKLFTSFSKVSINDLFTTCYSISLDCSNPFTESLCGNENLFNPYTGLDCVLQLQQQMADSVICMLGIPVFYFRVKPDKSTADYTFKEYILHNIESVKQIKMMIPDGQMPSSNPKYTALDFDWQTDWEVEIGKTEFATAFGDGETPKVRDFIYVPMMKRMWDVNAAYDEKNEGFMWQSTTWKLALVKYEDSTNVVRDDNMEELIDGWLNHNTYENVFGYKEDLEQERTTGITQIESPKTAATNLYNISMQDAIRQAYSKDEVSIIDYQYNHRSNVVARNIYKFKKPTSTVTYQKGYCGANGTLSFILQTQGMPTNGQDIVTVGPIRIKMTYQQSNDPNNDSKADRYIMECNGMKAFVPSFATMLVILRWNRDNYTVSLNCYEYSHEEGVAKYLLKPEMYWFNPEAIVSKTSEYNLDYDVNEKCDCYIQPYPCMMTNIKLYDIDLGLNDAIRESIKYTTTHKHCVINDLARHITSGQGYNVR